MDEILTFFLTIHVQVKLILTKNIYMFFRVFFSQFPETALAVRMLSAFICLIWKLNRNWTHVCYYQLKFVCDCFGGRRKEQDLESTAAESMAN